MKGAHARINGISPGPILHNPIRMGLCFFFVLSIGSHGKKGKCAEHEYDKMDEGKFFSQVESPVVSIRHPADGRFNVGMLPNGILTSTSISSGRSSILLPLLSIL